MPNVNDINFEIVSPQGIVFQGIINAVTLPAYNGTITVLPHHAPLFTKLTEGEVIIKKDGKETSVVISGGFLEVKNNSVHLLSDYAVRAESIKEAHTVERKRQAELKLKGTLDNEEFTTVDKDLKLSILELKVADKIRRRQRP